MTVLLLFSSPHLFSTGFRSEDWNGHSRNLLLCSVTHFCVVFEVCVWIIVQLEDPNMAHYKISNIVSHFLIFYLLVYDRISDAMCPNKMSRTSSRNIGQQHKQYSSIFNSTHGVLVTPVFIKLILSVCFIFKIHTQLFSAILQLWSLENLWPSHRALGRYRHTSSSRQFHYILCWLEILNISSFLKAASLICEAQLSFALHPKYIYFFFLIVMDD